MKVKELIDQLSKLDPHLEVYCYEDGPVSIERGPGPFDLTDASAADVDLKRIDGRPAMMFGGTGTHRVAIIGITPDF